MQDKQATKNKWARWMSGSTYSQKTIVDSQEVDSQGQTSIVDLRCSSSHQTIIVDSQAASSWHHEGIVDIQRS